MRFVYERCKDSEKAAQSSDLLQTILWLVLNAI
jgi:hypothetical protein